MAGSLSQRVVRAFRSKGLTISADAVDALINVLNRW